MAVYPPLPLVALWLLWVGAGVYSAVQVRRFSRLYDRPQGRKTKAFRPLAIVIVPFKGLDDDLAGHVRALCQQDYPKYELLLVVDSVEDLAYPVLIHELKRHPQQKMKVLVAGACGADEGQKVHNQLFAIDYILAREPQDPDAAQAWVFADSDAVPGPRWLGDLVGPLHKTGKTGVTTGYRWLVPSPGAPAWSSLASVMNSSVACYLGRDAYNHAWGGSMAVLADTAKRGDLRGWLTGALCDDYQFSRMSRGLGLRVYFVPRCMVATPVSFGFSTMVNFAHRQYLLTRVYAPKLYWSGLAVTTLYVAGLTSVVWWLWHSLRIEPTGNNWLWSVGVMGAGFIANQVRSSYRQNAVGRAFEAKTLQKLRPALRWDRWATPVWMTLHWVLMVRSAVGRTMNWRGVRYRLLGPQRVKKLG